MALLPRAFPIFPAWSVVYISFATSRAHLIWIMPFEMATSMTREQGGLGTSIVRSWACLKQVRNHCTHEEEQEGETVTYHKSTRGCVGVLHKLYMHQSLTHPWEKETAMPQGGAK